MTQTEQAQLIAKLREASDHLTGIDLPDEMSVTEWNATPVGRAVRCIGEAIAMIDGEDL